MPTKLTFSYVLYRSVRKTITSKTINKKLVVVGDGACGKKCLRLVFSLNKFPEYYIPTVFETYVVELTVDGRKVNQPGIRLAYITA